MAWRLAGIARSLEALAAASLVAAAVFCAAVGVYALGTATGDLTQDMRELGIILIVMASAFSVPGVVLWKRVAAAHRARDDDGAAGKESRDGGI